ncbi:MAG: type II secretion system protein [Candidatus Omnitrophica bacterium]|nr:type II secretion system protein [Candidatus Omnitrophota bacterium]
MKNDAFTFIELFIVIILIGILAGVVVPRFVDFRNEAQMAAEEASVRSIRSAIKLYSIDSALKDRKPFYPAVLDNANAGYAAPENSLFGIVLQNPISDHRWRKENDTRYKGPTGNYYTYDPVAGTFNPAETTP